MNSQLARFFILLSVLGIVQAEDISKQDDVFGFKFEFEWRMPVLMVEVRNDSESPRVASIDLDESLQGGMFGFPNLGAFKFFDSLGNRVPIRGDDSRGWWYPSLGSANLEPARRLSSTDTQFAGREERTWKFTLSEVFDKAQQFRVGNQEIAAFQVLFAIRVTGADSSERIEVVSDKLDLRWD